MYRCEISAEAPNFSSVEGEGRMEVVCKFANDIEITSITMSRNTFLFFFRFLCTFPKEMLGSFLYRFNLCNTRKNFLLDFHFEKLMFCRTLISRLHWQCIKRKPSKKLSYMYMEKKFILCDHYGDLRPLRQQYFVGIYLMLFFGE